MYPPRQFAVISVGALVVLGHGQPGKAYAAPSQMQPDQVRQLQTTFSPSEPASELKLAAVSDASGAEGEFAGALSVGHSDTNPNADAPQPVLFPTAKKARPHSKVAQLLAPNPSTIAPPVVPSPSVIAPALSTIPNSKPIGPAEPGPAPTYLNPDPNPLLLPTRPEQVRLKGIQPITLFQALELAERNNPSLQVTRDQLAQSLAQLREAQAALYPTFSVEGAVSRSQTAAGQLQELRALQNPLTAPTANSLNPVNQQFTGSATLNYDIFTSGQRFYTIAAARKQADASQLQVEVALEQLRLTVATSYFDLQEADEGVRIGQSAVRNAEASLRDAMALEQAGLGTKFDVLQAQVQLAQNQQTLTNALAAQQRRRRALAQLLNLPPDIDVAAADPVRALGDWKLSLDDSIVLAFRNRAELEQLLLQRGIALDQARVALAALGPTLSIGAQYNLLDSFQDSFRPTNGYSISLGARWTLFDGGAARSRSLQQEASAAIAESRFADTRNQIRSQVEDAYYQLKASAVNIGTNTKAVEQATEALRLARLRFQAGVGTQTDVINQEDALTRADASLVNAILSYNRAMASLFRAISNVTIKPVELTSPTPPSPPTKPSGPPP